MSNTPEYPFSEKVLQAVIDGNEQNLYDITMRGGIEYEFFKRYREETQIKISDESDPEQMYLRGFFEGMGMFLACMEDVFEKKEEK